MKTLVIITGLGVLAACCAFAQSYAKPQETGPPAAPATAPAAVNASGSIVFVDPVTRKVRKPSASEIGAQRSQSQAARAARPATPPVLIHGPGAAVGILLDDSDMSFTVATRKADGKIAVDCVTGDAADHAAADHAAQSPQPGKAAAETK
jgi:hypothetical protein